MANTITKQTLVDNERNLVVKVHIVGDGTGDEATANLLLFSDYTPNLDGSETLMKIQSNLVGFSASLIWDATTNVDIMALYAGDSEHDFTAFGGLKNNAGTGVTGNVLLQTVGLGAGDEGTIILCMKKH